MHFRRYTNDFDKVLETHRKHVYSLRRQLLNMDSAGCDAYISKCDPPCSKSPLARRCSPCSKLLSGSTTRCMLLMVDGFMSKHVGASDSPKQWCACLPGAPL